jgi:hypothetical protein
MLETAPVAEDIVAALQMPVDLNFDIPDPEDEGNLIFNCN